MQRGVRLQQRVTTDGAAATWMDGFSQRMQWEMENHRGSCTGNRDEVQPWHSIRPGCPAEEAWTNKHASCEDEFHATHGKKLLGVSSVPSWNEG